MEKYLTKIRKSGSKGLHVYFSNEVISDPDFKLKEGEQVVIIPRENGVDIRKVDLEKIMEG